MARPPTDDSGKYQELGGPKSSSKTQSLYIIELLRKAIRDGRQGFGIGESIAIRAAAKGLDTSRTTVAIAAQQLLAEGYLELSGPNSPYTIVSKAPLLLPSCLADQPIRVTAQTRGLGDASMLLEPLRFCVQVVQANESELISYHRKDLQDRLLQPSSAPTKVIDEAICSSLRNAVCEARWSTGDVLVFRRIRHIGPAHLRRAWLFETTYIALSVGSVAPIEASIQDLYRRGASSVSLMELLENQLTTIHTGWTRMLVVTPPERLKRDLIFAQSGGVATRRFWTGEPLLHWDFGMFASGEWGLVTFTHCLVDPTVMPVYAGKLDFRPVSTEPPV